MYAHHRETIQRVTSYFAAQPAVEALLLCVSIAHGFAEASSDVDLMIIVSPDEFQQRLTDNSLQFFSTDLATYANGYVDGKYLSAAFLTDVEQRGSEPARFAFADAQVLFTRMDGLTDQLQRIVRYPHEDKANRISGFFAQFQAWHWYVGEAAKKNNAYLMGVATSKLLLFGGRMILAHNELLYPYHKWFLAMLARAEHKPAELLHIMQELSAQPTYERATTFYTLINEFRDWETEAVPWPHRFMLDTELTWLHGTAPIDDV